MARKTVLVSDISGKEITDGEGATLTISYHDARRGVVRLDVNASEVADLASKGTKQARRGRRPGGGASSAKDTHNGSSSSGGAGRSGKSTQ
jgi:hypothetical protein